MGDDTVFDVKPHVPHVGNILHGAPTIALVIIKLYASSQTRAPKLDIFAIMLVDLRTGLTAPYRK